MTKYQQENIAGIFFFLFIFLIDQVIKYRSVLTFDYYLNDGLVFGLIPSNILGIIISFLLIIAAAYFILFKKVAFFPLVIVGSALTSNLIDRFIYQGVVDYWSFFNLFWFNLSDVFIVLVAAAALYLYFGKRRQAKKG